MPTATVHITIPARRLIEPIETYLFNKCDKYAYAVEKGKTGFIHYQTYANITTPKTANADIPQGVVDEQYARQLFYPFHVEIARYDDGCDYIYKDGCYFTSWMECDLQFNWRQSQLVEIIRDWMEDEEADRIVLNLIDLKGGFGKTVMSRIMDELCIAVRVPQLPMDKISGFLMEQPKYGFYVFDLTKVDGRKKLDNLYSAIEELKNGVICDWRYKGRQWKYKLGRPVHVVIFSNSKISSEFLSEDRIVNLFIHECTF